MQGPAPRLRSAGKGGEGAEEHKWPTPPSKIDWLGARCLGSFLAFETSF
jgi:hypothetical protein